MTHMTRDHGRLRNDLYCVGWGVKLYSLTHPETMAINYTISSNAWN